MHTLVTRPEPQASQWVADLSAHGMRASALPVIAISGPQDATPVTHLWRNLSQQRLLMFVSPSAVDWFFKLQPPGVRWPKHTLAAAPGPGTGQALRLAGDPIGLTADHIVTPPPSASQFDSEALWPLLSTMDWAGCNITVISGGDDAEVQGRTWLTQQWKARGAQVNALLSYRRTAGQWQAQHQALARQALAQPQSHLWLLSSSQGLANLLDHHLPSLTGERHTDLRLAIAICTHPKISQSAQKAGFGTVIDARPTLEAVVQARRTWQAVPR